MTDIKWAEEKAEELLVQILIKSGLYQRAGVFPQEVKDSFAFQYVIKELLEAKRDGFNRGIEKAALEVETHWNSSDTMTNQKQQALRSAYAVRKLKGD